jgi:hypothetical protein
MAAEYQLTAPTEPCAVIRTSDGAYIPPDMANRDYNGDPQSPGYLQWLADGGVPDPYVSPKPPPPDAPAIVDQSYRAGLVREADQLQAQGRNYDAIKLLFKANS